MNIKNLSLILFFLVVCYACLSEAKPRRNRGRAGRNPKKSGEDPTIKFRESVEKYKKIREEKRKRSLERRGEYDGYFDEFSKINKFVLNSRRRHGKKEDDEEDSENSKPHRFHQFKTHKMKSNEEIEENNEVEKPKAKAEKPKTKTEKPKAKAEKPKAKAEKPKAKAEKPKAKAEKPKAKAEKPKAKAEKPKAKAEKPKAKVESKAKAEKPKAKVSKDSEDKKAKTTRKITKTRKIATSSKKSTVTVDNHSVNDSNGDIYQPKPGTKFQWQLSDCNNADTSVNADVFDFDLFDTPDDIIKEVKDKGKKVMCYFSGGTIESWRDDAEEYLDNGIVLEEMEDWEDENWVNINSSKLKPLIQNRLDMAVEKGCDGVEIDNVDGYTFEENDFTYNEQLSFNKWLAQEAHKRKLSIGLKNDINQINDLLPHYDWALNEECFEFGECEEYKPFIKANKAVFGVSYLKNSNEIAEACKLANDLKLDYQIKNLDLDADKIDCEQYK